MRLFQRIPAALVVAALLPMVGADFAVAAAPDATPEEITAIAQEAYIYLYPLVTMDVTRMQMINMPPGASPVAGPMNAFVNVPEYPTADDRVVVRPNFDTLYSSGWLDLTGGPVVVSAPDTGGRYYMLPMLDMWTDVFAVPGKRTTGTKAGNWAVVPPGWTGELPAGVTRIDATTPYVWIIGRTQTNGPKDYDAVHKIQDGYKITPLADWENNPQPRPGHKIDPSVDVKTPPLKQVNSMSGEKFFSHAMELLKVHPPHITDQPIVARMERIGLEVGQSFDFAAADPAVQQALQAAPASALKAMEERLPTMARVANGWSMNTDTMGVYGTYYLKRAIVSMVGLGANLPEDAVYPMNVADSMGQPMLGENKYVMHFTKEDLPPVDAFWSITMYDAEGYQSANPINRFAIGDRDALKFNVDGSLDIYLQHQNPGADKESNWLPSPASGALGVTMRLYAPQASVLEGTWTPPPVKRIQ